MHSYLGDTTGENIIGPAGDLRAQDIKLFMRIEEIELLDRPGVIKLRSDQLRGVNFGLTAAATAKRDGTGCKVRSGSGQSKDIAGWRSKPDLQMIIRASSATPKDTWGCTIMPYLTVADEDGIYPGLIRKSDIRWARGSEPHGVMRSGVVRAVVVRRQVRE
ncbi:hypothetical protein [Streptosporangium sp. H16]|uniref:hypothetical protein n=1 Tax=Streptosporangium sp. H16 TaxID=3444184 RepID=UPI003F7A043D